MDYLNKDFYKNFNFRKEEHNTEDQICKVELELGAKVPEELREVLLLCNGGSGNIGKYYIDLWSIEDIVDFYEDVMETTDNILIPFASDGCGMAFALDKKTAEIRVIPMDSLEYEYSKKCSDSFRDFLHSMYSGDLPEY